ADDEVGIRRHDPAVRNSERTVERPGSRAFAFDHEDEDVVQGLAGRAGEFDELAVVKARTPRIGPKNRDLVELKSRPPTRACCRRGLHCRRIAGWRIGRLAIERLNRDAHSEQEQASEYPRSWA